VLALVERQYKWPEGETYLEEFADGSFAGELTCVSRFHKLNRREIIGAVGRVCRYPRQMLYGSAELVHLLMEQKRRRFIPTSRRAQYTADLIEAEKRKPPELQNPAILLTGELAYEWDSGIRLSCSSGLFRNRTQRLKRSHRFVEEQEPAE
jgi:hypothetical protein